MPTDRWPADSRRAPDRQRTSRLGVGVCAIGLALSLLACIERPPSVRERRTAFDRVAAQPFLVSKAAPAHPMQVRFGGSLTYLGYDVAPSPVRAGQDAEITFFFRADEELDEDWQVFVHVEDGQGGRIANVDHAPAGGAYPVGAWRKGDVVRDSFRIRVPGGAKTVQLWSGFWYPPRDERMAIDDPASATQDGSNRLLAANLAVGN